MQPRAMRERIPPDMPAKKIQNEDEARRWIEEGKSYPWIILEYKRKYGIETTAAMWSNFRNRNGIEIRYVRDDNLIPWRINDRDRRRYAVEMLRMEARRRAGVEMTPDELQHLESWKAGLAEKDLVVHYAPGTEKGFYYVKRRPGIDNDLIREPDQNQKMTFNASKHGAK
ncbi:hypothetical protein AB0J80_36130 [Actinoplanes sp. NPDC049548]|uniref:hypothetical protein n=1 Tax=Actinoplanes sp. NPDC049548 TaxID=3155152 RepID=UPI003428E633